MKRLIGSVIGNILSILGVALNEGQLDTAESIISIVCMVIGLLITIFSAVIIPLVKWYKNAKQDGIIDESELDELSDILDKGNEEIQKHNVKGDGKDEDTSRNDE